MGKIPFHLDQMSRGHQFIGIGDGSPIDPYMQLGPKRKGRPIPIQLCIDSDDLLHKGILQQPVIETVCLFLLKDSTNGGIAQVGDCKEGKGRR